MDSVRVCLAGLGFGLFVAGVLDIPVRIANVFEVIVPTPEIRVGMIIIGGVTVLSTLFIGSRYRRARLRALTALLFTSLVAGLIAAAAGTLVFPFIARRLEGHHVGHWKGHLDYQESGRHPVELWIDAGDPGHVVSGRLRIKLSNRECAFELMDSAITPGGALHMDSGEEEVIDTVCQSEDGAELHTRKRDPSSRELELKVRVPGHFPVATGIATRAPG